MDTSRCLMAFACVAICSSMLHQAGACRFAELLQLQKGKGVLARRLIPHLTLTSMHPEGYSDALGDLQPSHLGHTVP